MRQITGTVAIAAICLALGLLVGIRLGSGVQRQSDSPPSKPETIRIKVTDQATAVKAFEGYLRERGREWGSTELDAYDHKVEQFGKSTFLIHATRKLCPDGDTFIHIADSDGIRPATLNNLYEAHRREFPRTFDRDTHDKIIKSIIRLHSMQPENSPAAIISGTSDIPGYGNHPLEPDLECAVRPRFSYEDEQGDIFYVVYTYKRIAQGVVSRYRIGFLRKGVGLFSVQCIVLGGKIGDYESRL